jgi:hypothetical protein
VRRERRWGPGKSLSSVIENSDFQDLGQDVWLPRKADVQYYSGEAYAVDKVIVNAVLTVDRLSLHSPDELFHVDLTPGTYVIDYAHDRAGRVPSLKNASVDELLRSLTATPPPARRTVWRWVLIAASATLWLLLLGLFAWRRLRTA